MAGILFLMHSKHASFTRFSRSAPEKYFVFRAISYIQSSVTSVRRLLRLSFMILNRSRIFGRFTSILRSKRPGRSTASSIRSYLLVAPMTTTLSLLMNPSISVNSQLIVAWLSKFVAFSIRLRFVANDSISSMNSIHGELSRAYQKRSRTRFGPTPMYTSMNSDPEADMKFTLDSPAVALARRVLPVPGGPQISTPRGSRAPKAVYLSGFLKQSITSCSEFFASSQPAMFSNLVLVSCRKGRSELSLQNI